MDLHIDTSQITIETERLILRSFEASDLSDFYAYASVPGVGEMAGWPHHQSIETSESILRSFLEEKEVFALFHKAGGKVIGSLGVHGPPPWVIKDERYKHLKTVKIGYVLSKDYWGQGLMPEAVKAVINYGFNKLGIEAFTCEHFMENGQSRRVIEKIGFEFVRKGEYHAKLLDKTFEEMRYILIHETKKPEPLANMHFKLYSGINEFYDNSYDLLMRHEAQNLIPLGNIIIGKEGKDKSGWRDPVNWFMATVSDDDGVQLVAVMTPPHNITLYARDNKIDNVAVDCLISGIGDVPVPGVMAKKDLALHFAGAYCSAKGITYETAMEQRIYELTEVNPEIPHMGTMRLVDEGDMHFLPYWLQAFYSSEVYGKSTMNIPQDAEAYLSRIKQKKIYVLEEHGKPVSIAGATRELQSVCGVGHVYTPPYFRKKGYATSCVARLSQIILDRGFTKCVLYTDLANPTSNSIYQKIGYRPICDSAMLKFIQPSEGNTE